MIRRYLRKRPPAMSRLLALCPLALLSLGACSRPASISARDAADANDTGQSVDAKNSSEREVLKQIPTMPSGAARRFGDLWVTAASPYAAASGRTCRPLELGQTRAQQTIHRLACTAGGAWFFVPDVFATSSPGPLAE